MEQINNPKEILDSLIEKKKGGKDPNTTDAVVFNNAWLALATQEGYNPELEKYLFDGFIYDGVYPFKKFFTETLDEKRDDLLQQLFDGKIYGKNADMTFKVLVHLTAAFINDQRIGEQHTKAVMIRMPKYAYNKEKKPLGTAPRNVIKYFFGVINPKADFELSKLQLDAKTETEWKAILSNAVEFAQGLNMSEKERNGMETAIAWFDLKPVTNEVVLSEDKASELQKVPAEAAEKHPINTAPSVNSESAPSTTPIAGGADNVTLSKLSPVLRQLSQQLEQIMTINKIQQERFDSQLTSYREQVTSLIHTNDELKNANMHYLEEKLNLQKQLEHANADIEDKDAAIAELREMQSVISRDEVIKSDEAMKRLASKLQLDYEDFCDAQNAEMSIALGENMRLQLQSVFDILINSGIPLE